MDNHTMQVDQNLYGFFGECACSNPDGEGTGYIGWWSLTLDELMQYHAEHVDEMEDAA